MGYKVVVVAVGVRRYCSACGDREILMLLYDIAPKMKPALCVGEASPIRAVGHEQVHVIASRTLLGG